MNFAYTLSFLYLCIDFSPFGGYLHDGFGRDINN